MAGFTVSKPYTMSQEEVHQAAEELGREMQRQHGLKYRWVADDTATFTRPGLDGKLSIHSDTISLSVKLGMLGAMFEKPLKKACNEFLDEHVT